MNQKLVMKKILEECSGTMSAIHKKQLEEIIDYVLFEEELIEKWLWALQYANRNLTKESFEKYKNEILSAR
jgi:hypothetical protein